MEGKSEVQRSCGQGGGSLVNLCMMSRFISPSKRSQQCGLMPMFCITSLFFSRPHFLRDRALSLLGIFIMLHLITREINSCRSLQLVFRSKFKTRKTLTSKQNQISLDVVIQLRQGSNSKPFLFGPNPSVHTRFNTQKLVSTHMEHSSFLFYVPSIVLFL